MGRALSPLVFDRGGYSGKVFRYLKQQGLGFLTYLKGRKAGRRYPVKEFQTSWFSLDNQRHTYRVYEKKTRVTDAGMVRTIVFIGNDAKQIPVLTNLDASFQPAKIIHCLKLRWRQENSFKYLSEHYGVEQIIQYGADVEKDPRKVPTPKRKALKQKLQAVSQEVEALEAELGRALDQNEETKHRTARGLKIAHSRPSTSPGGEAASPDSASQPFATYARSHRRNRCRQDTFTAARRPSSGSQRPSSSPPTTPRDFLRFASTTTTDGARTPSASSGHYCSCQETFNACRRITSKSNSSGPTPTRSPQLWKPLMHELNQEKARLLGDGPILSFALASSVNMNSLDTDPLTEEF